MKKIIISTLILIGIIVPVQAQISAGGTPPSFGQQFKNLSLAQTSLETILLPQVDWQKVKEEDKNTSGANRFALAIPVDFSPRNAGQWTELPNGGRIWRLKIKSEGAKSLRFLFDDFWLPENAQLYIYDEHKQYLIGALTSRNNKESRKLGTDLIRHHTVILEYYEPRKVKGQGRFHLHRVDHGYRSESYFFAKDKMGTSILNADTCNININCPQGDDWQDEKRGVVRVTLTGQSGSFFCTGSLINNTAQDGQPLVLSANHCIIQNAQNFTDTWVFTFNLESSSCESNEPLEALSISGATLLARTLNSDFQLLKLSTEIPFSYNVYFNGWNRAETLPTRTTSIHHPRGDIKKISVDNDPATSTAYLENQVNANETHLRVIWEEGTTEGGSSGSPLFDQDQLIIGQLHGGQASCELPFAPDWYGKFSLSWDARAQPTERLQDWLDPIAQDVMSLGGKEHIPLENDIGIDAITLEALPCDIGSNTPFVARLVNRGETGYTNLVLNYEVKDQDGNLTSSGSTQLNSLAAGGVEEVSFNADVSFEYSLELSLDQNFTDDNQLNNRRIFKVGSFDIPLINQFPYIQNFEQDADSWQDFNQVVIWERGTPNGTIINTASNGNNAWTTVLDGNYSNNQDEALLSPIFDFSNMIEPEISADVFINLENQYDGVQLQVSTDCGTTWIRLGDLDSGENWYNQITLNDLFGSSGDPIWSGTDFDDWQRVRHPLMDFIGESRVQFRFLFRSDISNVNEGFGLDNFRIIDKQVTSIEDELAQEIQLYPNPAQDFITLNWAIGATRGESVEIVIYDHTGREHRRLEQEIRQPLSIPLQGLSAGLYIFGIKTSRGIIHKKIILK